MKKLLLLLLTIASAFGQASVSFDRTTRKTTTPNLVAAVRGLEVDRTDLAGGTALTVNTHYQDGLATDRTLTFSGTPAEGTSISLKLAVSAVSDLTFPASKRFGEADATVTTIRFWPGTHLIIWTYIDGEWTEADTVGILNNLSPAGAPAVTDDEDDGYQVGSIWIHSGSVYQCTDATAGAAVWSNLSAGGTDDQNASEVPSTPAGDLAADDVQEAVNELDTEKAPKASPTFTGTVIVPDNSFALGTKTTGNYAAGDGEAGAATSGDSASGFFPSGTIEDARLPATLDNKTLTSAIVGLNGTADGLTDDTYDGLTITGRAAGEAITQWDLVFFNSSDSEWHQADADAAGEFPARGIAVAAGTDGNALTVLVQGIVRNDGWAWATIGGPIYLSDTAGGLTQTAPSTTGDAVQIVGWAMSDDEAYLNFSGHWVIAP